MSAAGNVQRRVLNQDLLQAVLNGDGLATRRLIDLGADVNYHPGEELIPLMLNDAKPEEVKKLIEQRVMSSTTFGNPLLLAALRQDMDIVDFLLDNGANIDYDQHAWFKKALRELALEGALEMMAVLAEYGDHINNTPRTALCATFNHTYETIGQNLLWHSSNPDFPLGWPLVTASQIGNEDAVKALLDTGATQLNVKHWTLELYDMEQDAKVKNILFSLVDLDKRREFGWSAIGAATSKGFAKIVEMLLLNESLDTQACNEAFWLASKDGNDKVVQVFLSHGVEINFNVGFARGNPLTIAARNGRESTVALLLKHNADPRFSIGGAPSPLEQAITFDHKNIANMLLKAGANANSQKEGDITPLIKAVQKGDVEFCKVLLNHGADINAVCGYLGSALVVAASVGDLEMFKTLLNHGAVFDVEENGSTTMIGAACGGEFSGGGSIDIVRALIFAGVDVNQPTERGTPLQIAASRKKGYVVRFLVDNGADINARSKTYDKNTPLESAVMGGDVSIVKFLLEKGAVVTDAVTLLQLAATFADEYMVGFLMDTNPQLAELEYQFPEILDSAAKSENFRSITAILKRTKRNIATDYTLKKAVRGNQEDLTKLLLTKGSTVSSAIGWAISYKRKGICWTLLHDYINDNDKELLDYALQGAASHGWQDMADNVLNRGANVNAVIGSPDSDNILLYAIKSGHIPTIRLLLDRGSDLSTPGALGKALQIAAGNEKIKRLLVSQSKKPAEPQVSLSSGASAPEQHVQFAPPPKVELIGKEQNDSYEPPQPPLVARYRAQMSAPKEVQKKTKEQLEAELQVRLKIEEQALAEYDEKTDAYAIGPARLEDENIVTDDEPYSKAAVQTKAPHSDDKKANISYDYSRDDYVADYDVTVAAVPVAQEHQIPAAIQPPVDGLEKPIAISKTAMTCNLTLAVFRADSKGTVQRRLCICRPNRPDRTTTDIDTDEKLFRAMRKTYNHELSSFLRRLLSLKSLKQITVLSYTATTRPTPVPYDDFTLQEIMYLFRNPSHLSSASQNYSVPSAENDDQPWIDWVFRLKTSDNGRKHILRFEEAWDGTKIAIAGSLPFVASCVIAVAWSARGGDVQTVFAVASFVLGAGTALLALVAILSSVGS